MKRALNTEYETLHSPDQGYKIPRRLCKHPTSFSTTTTFSAHKPPNKLPPLLSPSPSQFHYFPLLPHELRLKIWHHTLTPRFVHFTSSAPRAPHDHRIRIAWDPSHCHAYCNLHPPPRQEPIPILLHVYRESRAEGLRLYTISKSPEFCSGYVNLEIDTLIHSRCHHESLIAGHVDGVVLDNPRIWEGSRSVLARLVGCERVGRIKKLAVCVCEALPFDISSVGNIDEVVGMLMSFKGLEELMFLESGDKHTVEELREEGMVDDNGVAVLDIPTERPFWRGIWTPYMAKRRTRMKMEHVLDLEEALRTHPAVMSGRGSIPRFRYGVVDQGVVVSEGKLPLTRRYIVLKRKSKKIG